MSSIVTDLKGLLDLHLLQKIGKLVAGVTCNFLGISYQGFIDGLCFQAVVGFDSIANSYVACAVFSMILVIVMYGVWRLRIDNYNVAEHTLEIAPLKAWG